MTKTIFTALTLVFSLQVFAQVELPYLPDDFDSADNSPYTQFGIGAVGVAAGGIQIARQGRELPGLRAQLASTEPLSPAARREIVGGLVGMRGVDARGLPTDLGFPVTNENLTAFEAERLRFLAQTEAGSIDTHLYTRRMAGRRWGGVIGAMGAAFAAPTVAGMFNGDYAAMNGVREDRLAIEEILSGYREIEAPGTAD